MCENEATGAHSCPLSVKGKHMQYVVSIQMGKKRVMAIVLLATIAEKNQGETINRNLCKDCQGINFIIQVFIYLLVGPNTITKNLCKQ